MKKFIFGLVLVVSQTVLAQNVCAPSSPEMTAYMAQKNWRTVSITDPNGAPEVHGYVDQQNRLHVDDLTRRGNFAAKVTVDPANGSYREFFRYCREGKGKYLRAMRKGRENNRYTVSLRYLPVIQGFANDPLKDQGYKENEVDVRVNLDSTSTILTEEVFADRVRKEVVGLITDQIKAGKESGLIQLDLTGWDDVVCDILQGKVNITVGRDAISKGPLVQQKKVVEPLDVQTAYQSLREQVSAVSGKEKALFLSGRVLTKLEGERRIGSYNDKTLFDMLKGVMVPDMSRVAEVDRSGLECLSEQLQSYERPIVQHVMNIQFAFPKLSDLDPQGAGRE